MIMHGKMLAELNLVMRLQIYQSPKLNSHQTFRLYDSPHQIFISSPQPPVPVPEEIKQWQVKRDEFDRQWAQLSSAIKGMAMDPLRINCSLGQEEMLQSAVSQMEGESHEE